MILLDCYCTLTCTKRLSSFLCVFWPCMQATIYSKFLNDNGDLAFIFYVMLSSNGARQWVPGRSPLKILQARL